MNLLSKKYGSDVVALPPIEGDKAEAAPREKPAGTKDERFRNLFESLSSNLFTEEHGRHPLTQ